MGQLLGALFVRAFGTALGCSALILLVALLFQLR